MSQRKALLNSKHSMKEQNLIGLVQKGNPRNKDYVRSIKAEILDQRVM